MDSFEEMREEHRNSLEYVLYRLTQFVSNQTYDVYDESGLSKNDFAKRLGISRRKLNRILDGFENVDLKFIAKLEKEFGYKIDLSYCGKILE
jgi:transcriptional regulator with XRE-family HTH domain